MCLRDLGITTTTTTWSSIIMLVLSLLLVGSVTRKEQVQYSTTAVTAVHTLDLLFCRYYYYVRSEFYNPTCSTK